MKRILILGCCGSGKSTLARGLHQKTKIPIIHLDQEYWQPNWTETPKEKWNSIVKKLVQRDTWIMDGNYSSSFYLRFPRADTIIYLDKSTSTCMWRVCKRVLTHYGKVRPDMVEGCAERFDLEFMHYVLTFNLRNRKKLLRKIKDLKSEKQVFIFRKEKEIEAFLAKSFIEN